MYEATIKHLIGHGPGSTIMETTCQHLSDDDHIRAAEIAQDLQKPEDESSLTPEVCPTCPLELSPNESFATGSELNTSSRPLKIEHP
jgi:hypothetical protein